MNIPLYKRHVLSVDSRNREGYGTQTAAGVPLTTPNSYTIKFPPIRNVKALRLLTSSIPNTAYVINSTNNIITFDSDAAPATAGLIATLTEGTYTAAELANEINLQMNTAMGVGFGVNLVATYITYTQKIVITRTDGNNFLIYWTSDNSPYLELGMHYIDMPALTTTVSSNDVVNLSGDSFIYLCIKDLASVRGSEILENIFAKVIFVNPPRSYSFDSFATNMITYPEPLNQIAKFEIVWKKHDGTTYDFNQIDHEFTVEFYTTE